MIISKIEVNGMIENRRMLDGVSHFSCEENCSEKASHRTGTLITPAQMKVPLSVRRSIPQPVAKVQTETATISRANVTALCAGRCCHA